MASKETDAMTTDQIATVAGHTLSKPSWTNKIALVDEIIAVVVFTMAVNTIVADYGRDRNQVQNMRHIHDTKRLGLQC